MHNVFIKQKNLLYKTTHDEYFYLVLVVLIIENLNIIRFKQAN